MTHDYYVKHGGRRSCWRSSFRSRTFAPVVAGVARMGYRQFATYNVIGAILWIGSMTTAGYTLGNLVPQHREPNLHYVVAIVIAISPDATGDCVAAESTAKAVGSQT